MSYCTVNQIVVYLYCNQKGIRLLQQSPCIYSHFKVILLWLQQQKAQ
nr:MAG TPA: hypothetical protein [Caudoviricetes sp.]